MKFLYDLLEKQEKHFLKGGKLETLYPLFEAGMSFHFSTQLVTKVGAHVRDFLDTKRYMIMVVIAMLPCVLFGVYNIGYQSHVAGGLSLDTMSLLITGLKSYLPLLIVTFAVGGLWEALFAVVRKHEINEGFLVSGMLFPLISPPDLPLWMAAVGISFGVVVGKEIFGGSGRNFLNPALTARAFLFFTYPAYMSGDSVWTLITVSKDQVVDTFSGATALAVAALTPASNSVTTALTDAGFTFSNLFFGLVPGSIGETSALCVLIGAVILVFTGIGSWRTMLGCVIGCLGMGLIFNLVAGPQTVAMMALPAHWHLVMGGFAFGAVFMATDPVSSPALEESKWVYGILIGALTVIIRAVNPAYPEGMMLSILLMNVFAPLIDHVFLSKKLKKRIPNVL